MPSIILECTNVCKRIKSKEILKNINLKLYESDILGLIGPNGAGKTTLIKVILSLQKITSGQIKINGYDIAKNYQQSLKSVGAIVENPDLYNYLSGLDNLLISSTIYNISKSRLEEVINLLGLTNCINNKVSTYSLGMKQRLGIAQAILHKPKLLILDEPTNGLDPEGIKELRELIIFLSKKEHMTILVSSHNLKELESFCTKIAMIQKGNLISCLNISNIKYNKHHYIFELDKVKIGNIISNYKIIDSNHIKVSTSKDKIPNIIKKLINQNIKIYSIQKEILSLEEVFLKKTGGNIIE